MTIPENKLVDMIRSGDVKAFENVFKNYYSRLCMYAYDILQSDELAEEAVQETLIRIWETRSKLNIYHSLKAYLYRSVHNQCLNMIKRLRTEQMRVENYTRNLILDSDVFQTNELYFETNPCLYEGVEKDIEAAINLLPEQCRKVFILSRFDRLTYQEIAVKMNISINTVKTQLRRGLEKIRANVKGAAR